MKLIVELEPWHNGWRWQLSEYEPDVADEPDPFAAGLDPVLSDAGAHVMMELFKQMTVRYRGAAHMFDPIHLGDPADRLASGDPTGDESGRQDRGNATRDG